MDAGELRDRIEIKTPAMAQDRNGNTIAGMGDLPADAWARVRQMPSTEQIRNGMSGSDEVYAIRIRWRDDIQPNTQITYRCRTLEVASSIEGGHANREWIDIIAKRTR